MPVNKNVNHGTKISRNKRTSIDPLHGHVFSPASRAYFAWQEGKLNEGQLNQCESGKFFPETQGGLPERLDPVEDARNNTPPPDGKIASANQSGSEILDEAGSHWQKHQVKANDALDISWAFTANHVTRRWNYFITREGWDPAQPLSRAQFESEPFYMVQNNQVPAWQYSDEMKPPTPTVHTLVLPRREGYHVLLGVWEVADTGNAFYQVLDLDFESDGGGTPGPVTPTGLRVEFKSEKHVSLAWNPSNGSGSPVATYRIYRDNKTSVDIPAPLTIWNDYSVTPSTTYQYTISAIDSEGIVSAPSAAITVTTPVEGSSDFPPGAPKNLHEHGVSANSITIMWGASDFYLQPVNRYLIYRDGVNIHTVYAEANKVSYDFLDSGLQAETTYRYYVKAVDITEKVSPPSNTLSSSTTGEEGGDYPQWVLEGNYTVGDKVSNLGKNWECLASHIAYEPNWAPGAPDGFTLWKEI